MTNTKLFFTMLAILIVSSGIAFFLTSMINDEIISESHKYTIEQGYIMSQHKTWVWYGGEIARSWTIDTDTITCEAIERTRQEAEMWIKKIEQCKPITP